MMLYWQIVCDKYTHQILLISYYLGLISLCRKLSEYDYYCTDFAVPISFNEEQMQTKESFFLQFLSKLGLISHILHRGTLYVHGKVSADLKPVLWLK